MKTKFYTLFALSIVLMACGGEAKEDDAEEHAEEVAEETVEETASNLQDIELSGFEGTLEGANLKVRNTDIEEGGIKMTVPVVDIDDRMAFTIRKTTKNFADLRKETEASKTRTFYKYVVEGDNYFIAKTAGNNKGDTLYTVIVLVPKGETRYILVNPDIEAIETAQRIAEAARTYKPR